MLQGYCISLCWLLLRSHWGNKQGFDAKRVLECKMSRTQQQEVVTAQQAGRALERMHFSIALLDLSRNYYHCVSIRS